MILEKNTDMAEVPLRYPSPCSFTSLSWKVAIVIRLQYSLAQLSYFVYMYVCMCLCMCDLEMYKYFKFALFSFLIVCFKDISILENAELHNWTYGYVINWFILLLKFFYWKFRLLLIFFSFENTASVGCLSMPPSHKVFL